jgi:hypothetical protein
MEGRLWKTPGEELEPWRSERDVGVSRHGVRDDARRRAPWNRERAISMSLKEK